MARCNDKARAEKSLAMFSKPITILLYYLLIINVLTFAAFVMDKFLAQQKWWRIAEKSLWILSLLGGSVGGLIGMAFARHKTKKATFQLVMALIVVLQAFVIWFFIVRNDTAIF